VPAIDGSTSALPEVLPPRPLKLSIGDD